MGTQTSKMAIYEVTYSTKTTSNDKLSFSDIVLVEAETHEELYTKVVDTLLRTLGPSGNYYVDSIGDTRMNHVLRRELQRREPKTMAI
jgi:hypothetical protein